ncbi:hypothetical protein [Sulfitobacter alexandrii]|uniref:hypothetical protein n=1 Tax=Sulfitobacter alexandrii TaxID=1917485 RepID=UPI0012EC4EEB|nr:hypothetical protein [Sulfitobacter alexandrii]
MNSRKISSASLSTGYVPDLFPIFKALSVDFQARSHEFDSESAGFGRIAVAAGTGFP